MMNIFYIVSVASLGSLLAGPFAPAAGEVGSKAVAVDDPRVRSWAKAVTEYLPGEDVDEMWRTPADALGEAEGNSFDIVGLGRGGEITLEFSPPIQDGKGVDFAVFENGFTDTFLELAYVEVSSDGITFFRFENASETGSAVGPYGALDPTDVSGLAGKYRQGFGTPFDLSELVGAEALDRSAVKYVRLIDVVGGVSRDSSDRIIYDPWPGSGAAGFDLDGIASLALPPPEILSTEIHEGRFVLRWVSEPGCSYRVEASGLLGSDPWVLVEEFSALATVAETSVSLDSSARRFFRVVLE